MEMKAFFEGLVGETRVAIAIACKFERHCTLNNKMLLRIRMQIANICMLFKIPFPPCEKFTSSAITENITR